MKPFRLRLVACIFLLLGFVAFGAMLWISTWERVDRGDGFVFVIPNSNGASFAKPEILPLLGQLGGAAFGVGLAWLILAQIVEWRQKRAAARGVPLPERPRATPARTAISVLIAIVIAVFGTIGWRWYDYVANAESPYDEVGIALTGWMPLPIRQWGCGKLHARFTGALPPLGCGDASGKKWL